MRYFNNKILFLVVALTAFLVGCSKELPLDIVGDGATLALSIEGGVVSSQSSMRAVSEATVTDVWVLQFDNANKLVRKEYIAVVTDVANLRVKTVMGQNMSLWILANSGDANLFNTDNVGAATLTTIKAKILTITSVTGVGLPSDVSTSLPMIGEKGSLNLPTAITSPIQITLTRLVSKISLNVKNKFETGYPLLTISSVQLKSVPTVYSLQPTTAPYPATTVTFKNYTAVTGNATAAGRNYTWYMVPNKRGVGTNTDPRLKNETTAPSGQGAYCTYVEILGTVMATASSVSAEVRYRLYLGANNTTDFNIVANTAYNVNVELTGFNSSDARMVITTGKFDISSGGSGGDFEDNVGWEVPFYGDFKDGGILYWLDVNNPKGNYKVVALARGSGLNWASDLTSYNIGAGYAQDATSGEKNLLAVQAFASKNNKTFSDFAAVNFCYTYKGKDGTDPVGTWFLPSKDELSQLSISHTTNPEINKAIASNSGVQDTILNITHRTATEVSTDTKKVYSINLSNNLSSTSNKTGTTIGIRCIRHIRPATVGEYRDGGLVFWVNSTDQYKYKVVALDEEIDGSITKTYINAVATTNVLGGSATDGMQNTLDMKALVGDVLFATTYPAAAYCYNYKGRSGMDAVGTWYLPAQDELGELHKQWKGGKLNNAVFAANWAVAFTAAGYWSSTQNATVSTDAGIWTFVDGSGSGSLGKLSNAHVRCIRRKI